MIRRPRPMASLWKHNIKPPGYYDRRDQPLNFRSPPRSYGMAVRRWDNTRTAFWLDSATQPRKSRHCGPLSTRHDRFLLLAHAKRLESLDHARGERSAVHLMSDKHRYRPSVQTGISENQPQCAHAGYRRPGHAGPADADFRIGTDPDPSGGKIRPVHADIGARPQRVPRVAVLAGGQSRPDGRSVEPLRQLREGCRWSRRPRLCAQALRRRVQSLSWRVGTPTGWAAVYSGRIFHRRHDFLAVGADFKAARPGVGRFPQRVALA